MANPLSSSTQSLPPSSTTTTEASDEIDKHINVQDQEEEEDDDDDDDQKQERVMKKYLELVSALPKERGWLSEEIREYQGFWYSPGVLKGLLILQQHFQAQPGDILLASFPKSGTTWLKALLFTLTHPTTMSTRVLDMDLDPQNNHPLLTANPHELVPMLESYAANNPVDPRPKSSSSWGLMHTHIPCTSLPDSIKAGGSRIVYVFRDPKDVLVSCWHFVNVLRPESVAPVSLPDAFRQFCSGASPYGPYWDHVLGYWKASEESPDAVFFLSYEDLKRDGCCHTRRLSEFLGHPLPPSDEDGDDVTMISKLVDFCSFEKLSNLEVNKTGSHSGFGFPVIQNRIFFRQGQVGDSNNHLTTEMMDELDGITRLKWKQFPRLIALSGLDPST